MNFFKKLLGIGKTVINDIDHTVDVIRPFEPLLDSIPGAGPVFMGVFKVTALVETLVSTGGTNKQAAAVALLKQAFPSASPDELAAIVNLAVSFWNAASSIEVKTGTAQPAIPSAPVVDVTTHA